MKSLTLLERYEALKQEVDELNKFNLRFEEEVLKPKLEELLEIEKNVLIAKKLEEKIQTNK